MKRVAVIKGGSGDEYDTSILTGNAVLSSLLETDYPYREITITKTGDWLSEGRCLNPDQALEGIDVAFVALQGSSTNIDQVQRMLERKRIPYTGSRALVAGTTQNKEIAKQMMRSAGAQTAKHRRIGQSEKTEIQAEIEQIIIDMGTDLYIKPLRSRSPKTYRSVDEAKALEQNLVEMLDMYDDLLIEQKVPGTSAQVGVLEQFRDEPLYTFPVHELEHDYARLARFLDPIKQDLAQVAKLAHKTLGCDQYSLVDLMVVGDTVVFLKIDSHPELTATDNYATAAESIGLSHRDLIRHLIDTAQY